MTFRTIMVIAMTSMTLTSCSSILTTGNTVPMGPNKFLPTNKEHVIILFETPSRAHHKIGIVSALGGTYTDEGRMYERLQIEAAKLGADAVIVRPTAPKNYWEYPKNSGTAIKYQ